MSVFNKVFGNTHFYVDACEEAWRRLGVNCISTQGIHDGEKEILTVHGANGVFDAEFSLCAGDSAGSKAAVIDVRLTRHGEKVTEFSVAVPYAGKERLTVDCLAARLADEYLAAAGNVERPAPMRP